MATTNCKKLSVLPVLMAVVSLFTTQCVPASESASAIDSNPLPETYSFASLDFPEAIWTTLSAINNMGDIVGDFSLTAPMDVGENVSSFVWTVDLKGEPTGGSTVFTVPGGVTNTSPLGINNQGQVVGWYYDESGIGHGYVRSAIGEEFETIDHPNAVIETFVLGINDFGDVSGFYITGDEKVYGYVRSNNGEFTDIEHPNGAGQTFATRIDNAGYIVGFFRDELGTHAFVRSPDGEFDTFDHPLASGTTCGQTRNNFGEIAGFYMTEESVYHGYVRSADGQYFNTIDHPEGAAGTMVFGLNDFGQIVGSYTDASGATHGFIATP